MAQNNINNDAVNNEVNEGKVETPVAESTKPETPDTKQEAAPEKEPFFSDRQKRMAKRIGIGIVTILGIGGAAAIAFKSGDKKGYQRGYADGEDSAMAKYQPQIEQHDDDVVADVTYEEAVEE